MASHKDITGVAPDDTIDDTATCPPAITLTKGNPTDEELAALTVVLTAISHRDDTGRVNDDRPITGGWKSYWRTVRQPFVPGREAWRGSLR